MPSLLEAIDNKYGKFENCETCDCDVPIAIFVPKRSQRLQIPSLLVLNDCDIDTAGDEQNLEKICHVVEELDLAQNKLAKWGQVFDILKHMPRLKFVNLSFNSLKEELDIILNQNPFPFLKSLVLNGTYVDWHCIKHLLSLLPSLEELHLSLNEYTEISLTDEKNSATDYHSPHLNIKKVYFTGNPVRTWGEISKLGAAFPCLECLVLAQCPLESLDQSPDGRIGGRTESECESSQTTDAPHSCFRHLHFLNLNNTLLSTWDEIDRLSRFPALHCLRIQGCPLFEEFTEHERRQMLIARLPNVQTLNGGGVIGDEEREDAERAFIRRYMDKPESDRPERYNDLITVHGKLDPLVQIDLSPEKKVKITFSCGEVSEVRSISVYQSVQELKQKLETFAGIPVPKMRLFYVDEELKDIMGPEEMRFPNKQLYSYNIATGDNIIIDSK